MLEREAGAEEVGSGHGRGSELGPGPGLGIEVGLGGDESEVGGRMSTHETDHDAREGVNSGDNLVVASTRRR